MIGQSKAADPFTGSAAFLVRKRCSKKRPAYSTSVTSAFLMTGKKENVIMIPIMRGADVIRAVKNPATLRSKLDYHQKSRN